MKASHERLNYCKWAHVITSDADGARAFFGLPAGWPAEFDHFDSRGRGPVFRVLSPAWIEQKNKGGAA